MFACELQRQILYNARGEAVADDGEDRGEENGEIAGKPG